MTTSGSIALRDASTHHAATAASSTASAASTAASATAAFGSTPAAQVDTTQTTGQTPGLYHDEWAFVMKTHHQMNALKKLEALPTPTTDQKARMAQLKATLTSEAPTFATMKTEAQATMQANSATTCTYGGKVMEHALNKTLANLDALTGATAAAATNTSTS